MKWDQKGDRRVVTRKGLGADLSATLAGLPLIILKTCHPQGQTPNPPNTTIPSPIIVRPSPRRCSSSPKEDKRAPSSSNDRGHDDGQQEGGQTPRGAREGFISVSQRAENRGPPKFFSLSIFFPMLTSDVSLLLSSHFFRTIGCFCERGLACLTTLPDTFADREYGTDESEKDGTSKSREMNKRLADAVRTF